MKNDKIKIVFFLFAAIILMQQNPAALNAQSIRLASPLPENSIWGETLKRLASEWQRATNNRVRVRILHDGREGGEEKMLSSLRSNDIQAALFTSFGLEAVCPPIMAAAVPFNIRNDEELNAVFDVIVPLMDEMVSSTRFHVLAWSRAGWVNIFSREPVLTPDDLKRLRIASNVEAEQMNNVFRTMGFNIVDADWIDVGPKINSGDINAVYMVPTVVAAFRLDDMLKHMMSLPIAPVIGGIVFNRVTWSRISPADQREITRITRSIVAELEAGMPQTDANAFAIMAQRGMQINRPNSAQEQLWIDEIQRVLPSLVGTAFDSNLFGIINGVIANKRNGR